MTASEQVANDLVAESSDAHPGAIAHKLADHPRTGVGLARTWWTLNSESRVVELRSDAYRELGRSSLLMHLERARTESRWPAQ